MTSLFAERLKYYIELFQQIEQILNWYLSRDGFWNDFKTKIYFNNFVDFFFK